MIASDGVEHVRRGHAEVQPARRLAGQLLDVGQEGDHVVPRALLVLEDARRDPACPRALARTRGRGARRHRARRLHRGAGGQLDLEPDVVAPLSRSTARAALCVSIGRSLFGHCSCALQ